MIEFAAGGSIVDLVLPRSGRQTTWTGRCERLAFVLWRKGLSRGEPGYEAYYDVDGNGRTTVWTTTRSARRSAPTSPERPRMDGARSAGARRSGRRLLRQVVTGSLITKVAGSAFARLDADRARQGLDDALDRGEADARAVGSGREEEIEDAAAHVFRNPGLLVGHPHDDALGLARRPRGRVDHRRLHHAKRLRA
ncbi:MAG: hypothetical protein R3E53_15175 [Myxococcota bacterium]